MVAVVVHLWPFSMETKPAQPTPAPRPSWHTAVASLLLVVLTLAAYQGVRQNDFVNLDDPDYITNNPNVKQGLTWTTIRWAFTTSAASNYHPLTWLSHALDYAWFGPDAAKHHLSSLALHAVNTLLLLLAMRRLTRTFWRSVAVAAVFALHPLHVESVAWVSERKDLLSGFCFMLCLLGYERFVRRRAAGQLAWPAYGFTLLAYAAGLLAKPMLVTLPCVLLLLDFWPLRRFEALGRDRWRTQAWPCVREKLPFLLLTLASSVATFLAQRWGGSMVSMGGLSLTRRVLDAFVGYAGYLGKTFWPAKLSVYYPLPIELYLTDAVPALLLVVAITVWACLRLRRAPWWFTGWFWFVGMLVPVIGLVQVGMQAMADRYTYLPMIGLTLGVAWSVAGWAGERRGRRGLVTAIGVALACVCVARTHQRVQDWRNSGTLFTQALAMEQRNFTAHANLGVWYYDQADYAAAEKEYRAALAVLPDAAPPWMGLGMLYMALERYAEAAEAFTKSGQFNPRDPFGPMNAGLALIQQKDFATAETMLRESLRRVPDFQSAQVGLALAQLGQRQTNLARASLEMITSQANAATPAATLDLIARLQEEIGDTTQALESRRHAVEVAPKDPVLRQRFGQLLASSGQMAEARREFETAIALSPHNAMARTQLATVLLEQGSAREALAEYRTALNLQTNLLAALNNLAWTLATHPEASLRNGAEAVAFGQRACALTEWKVPYIIGTLAAAYAENNQWPEAVETALKAQAAATKAGETELARRNGELAEQYRQHQPYREKPAKP